MNRTQLIQYIKKNDSFYVGASFAGHNDEQLLQIKSQVERKLALQKKTKNSLATGKIPK